MASIYDEFNGENDYEVWLGEVLLPELGKHGLPRLGRVLDVGCGTGRAFEPLLRRGWDVIGVDASAEMLKQAREKLPEPWGYSGRCELEQHDARELPAFTRSGNVNGYRGPLPIAFDLIIALNDVVNYLTGDGDLELAFEGMKKNLAPRGLICFDANTLGLFEGDWTAGGDGPMAERRWSWSGLTKDAQPGGIFEAELSGGGVEAHVHRERHWPREQVIDALEASGLRSLAVKGQREEGGRVLLEESADEAAHGKTIYIGGHDG
jgi:SAM-dependent methyltransferase